MENIIFACGGLDTTGDPDSFNDDRCNRLQGSMLTSCCIYGCPKDSDISESGTVALLVAATSILDGDRCLGHLNTLRELIERDSCPLAH